MAVAGDHGTALTAAVIDALAVQTAAALGSRFAWFGPAEAAFRALSPEARARIGRDPAFSIARAALRRGRDASGAAARVASLLDSHKDPAGEALPFGAVDVLARDTSPCSLLDGVDADIAPRLGGDPGAVHAALRRLRTDAPDHFAWVTRTVGIVLLTRGDGAALDSASNPDWAGAVRISAHPRWDALAEMLVHEASHQHAYLLDSLGIELVRADAGEAFSPLKGQDRPAGKLLLGLHAFANVALMYRSLTDASDADPDLLAGEARAREDVAVLRQSLASTDALTMAGEALVARIDAALV